MPAQLARLIRRFDVFLSTQRLQVCMSSFGEELVITFTTPFVSPDVQRSFFRILSGMGLCATVTTNFVNVEGAG